MKPAPSCVPRHPSYGRYLCRPPTRGPGARDRSLDAPVSKDLIVTTRAEITRFGDVVGTIAHEALSHGVASMPDPSAVSLIAERWLAKAVDHLEDAELDPQLVWKGERRAGRAGPPGAVVPGGRLLTALDEGSRRLYLSYDTYA